MAGYIPMGGQLSLGRPLNPTVPPPKTIVMSYVTCKYFRTET